MRTLLICVSILIFFESKSQDKGLDTLQKYSYLLTAYSYNPASADDKPSVQNMKAEYFGTGFFIRRKGRLFLASASHVITGYDVYKNKKVDVKIDYLSIRYLDSLGKRPLFFIRVADIKNFAMPKPFLEVADASAVEITHFPTNSIIHSIENLIYPGTKKKRKKDSTRLVSYGFPIEKKSKYMSDVIYIMGVEPSLYEGRVGDTTHHDPEVNQEALNVNYLTIAPASANGFSGAPVFFINTKGKKTWIEFAGVQAAMNSKYNCSYVVTPESLEKCIENVPEP